MEALRKILIFLVAVLLFAGCVVPGAKKAEVLDVRPVVDYNSLGGFTGEAKESLFVVAGDVDGAWENFREIATGNARPVNEFGEDDPLNFVVFRGVFPTGGYGLEIERVERRGNSFTIYAVYTKPGAGVMVTQAFTQPAALIPIGNLAEGGGSYDVRLLATVILKNEDGDKVLESGSEHARIEFKVG